MLLNPDKWQPKTCHEKDLPTRLHVLQWSQSRSKLEQTVGLVVHLYYYKNQGCVCVCLWVCVSCICRPPSHWWISFIFYTIIGLDREGGQWLFKLQSYNNKKNYWRNRAKYPRHRYTPQNSICGTVVKYRSTYPIKYDVTSCVLRVHAVVVVWLRVTVSAVSDLWYRILSLALKMKWTVQCQWCEWPWKWIGQCSEVSFEQAWDFLISN